MGLDPAGPTVPAKSLRARIALLAFAGSPPAHTRRAHSKPLACFAVRRAGLYRGQKPNSKIQRKSLRNACPPPAPAGSLNQLSPDLGIPFDSLCSAIANENQRVVAAVFPKRHRPEHPQCRRDVRRNGPQCPTKKDAGLENAGGGARRGAVMSENNWCCDNRLTPPNTPPSPIANERPIATSP